MRRSSAMLALPMALAVTVAQAADLDIEIRGIKTRTGHVNAALFSNPDDFSLDIAFRAMITREGDVSTGVFTSEEHMPRPPADTASAPANARVVHLHMIDLDPGMKQCEPAASGKRND